MKATQNSYTMSTYLGGTFLLIMTQFFMICTPISKTNEQTTTRTVKKLYKKTITAPLNAPTTQRDPLKDQLLKKTIRDMNLEELQEAKDYSLKLGNADNAIKFIERMIMLTKDQEQLCILRLELPDNYFEKGSFKQAGKQYANFLKFYPGSTQSDYAEYKSILSRFYARLQPPLDQRKTRKTIKLSQLYIDTSSASKKLYADEVKKIQKNCYQDLYAYELDIFNGYLKRNQLTGAQTHLTFIKNELLPVMKDIEPHLIECEILIAQKQANKVLVTEKTDYLKKTFPTYQLASNNKPKKPYVYRF